MSSPGVFELEPLIEPASLPPNVKVACMELCENCLYVGTNDGSVIKFTSENSSLSVNNVRREKIRELGPKSPVTFLRSASALDRLLALCDTTLMVLNAQDLSTLSLSGSHKMRGVQACCINENPTLDDPFAVQLCLGKKKQLAVININEEQMTVEKIRELPNPVKHVAMDGIFVCAALTSHYVIFNVVTGTCQDLFPYEPETHPIIARIAKEEFLLNAPGDLGMCITTEGMSSDKPPIQWLKPVYKFVFCYPHIVTVTSNNEAVYVYSILDQKHKQSLTFNGGVALGNFDGKILVASPTSVYRLKPISLQIQMEFLLSNERVDEALDLAESAASRGAHMDESFEMTVNRVRCRAAFISLKKMDLRKAQEQFIRGRVDPREVISLFPRMLPSTSNFTRAVPSLHDIADINQVSKMDAAKTELLTTFLVDFLEYLRASEGEAMVHKKEVDTALIKLYSRKSPEKLPGFVSSTHLDCDYEDCLHSLQEFQRHHVSALLLLKLNRFEEAFTIWTQLIKGVLTDDFFPGLQCFVDTLVKAPEEEIWRHVDFLLRQDQLVGLQAIIKRHDDDQMPLSEEKCEVVVNFLQSFPKAKMAYLEYLVNNKKLQVERFHTSLALIYLEAIESSREDEDRIKFRQHVVDSQCLQFPYLLSRLEATDAKMNGHLHYEKAIIFGKMREHEKALRIFVQNIGDYKEAEQYCNQMTTGQSRRDKEKLLMLLVTILLDSSFCNDSQADSQKLAAIDLLNRRADEFRPVEVLEKLPNDWSLSIIAPALIKMTKASTHRRRMTHIEKSLSQSVNLSTKMEYIQMVGKPFMVNESSYCVVCKKNFHDCQLARYPNGVLVHKECVKDPKVCPLTGQLFTIK